MGKLIEFYIPKPRPVAPVTPPYEEPDTSAADTLKKLLESADTISQIVVLTADKNGTLAFLGNCDGLAETLLFMDLVKAQALFSRIETPPGGGAAS